MTRFWTRWPSWLIEGISGVLLYGLIVSPLNPFLKAIVFSLGYEALVDTNGWSKKDFFQRLGGIFVGAFLFALLLGWF